MRRGPPVLRPLVSVSACVVCFPGHATPAPTSTMKGGLSQADACFALLAVSVRTQRAGNKAPARPQLCIGPLLCTSHAAWALPNFRMPGRTRKSVTRTRIRQHLRGLPRPCHAGHCQGGVPHSSTTPRGRNSPVALRTGAYKWDEHSTLTTPPPWQGLGVDAVLCGGFYPWFLISSQPVCA
jgi:hypothetical protein